MTAKEKDKTIVATQIVPGMALKLENKLFRVESCVKVSVPKGASFMKTKMENLANRKKVEKNFKLNQSLEEVQFEQRKLEFLYMEGKDYLFLDIDSLEMIIVPENVVGGRSEFLKEGVEAFGSFYENKVFSVELPQFLEIMVVKIEEDPSGNMGANVTKIAILETGAKVEVPPFIENGDIIKVDTKTKEYIQRV